MEVGERGEVGGSEAPSLRDLGAFLKSVQDSVPVFYSSKISIGEGYRKSRMFDVVLKRRRSRATDKCRQSEKSPIFRIAETDLLKIIRTLVACSTWTHAQFRVIDTWVWGLYDEEWLRGFKHLMFQVFSLLRSSPSLSSFASRNPRFCCDHFPTLLCENSRLETLVIHLAPTIGPLKFSVLAKSIALCLSRNSALKSFTIQIRGTDHFKPNLESLEMLLKPFTTSLPCEVNANLKELVLDFPDFAGPYAVWENIIANLVSCNTTLEKLELRFSNSWSCSAHLRTAACKHVRRALEVNHTLKEFGCFCGPEGLKDLIGPFIPDLSGRQPNTTLSTLHLFLIHQAEIGGGTAFVDDLVVTLNDMTSLLESSTTLKHVQLSHEGGRTWRDKEWNTPRHLEFRTQEKLKSIICNELRLNSSLESFAVGFWTLRRVGTEWQTSYGGPCLRPIEEYIVKMKMPP